MQRLCWDGGDGGVELREQNMATPWLPSPGTLTSANPRTVRFQAAGTDQWLRHGGAQDQPPADIWLGCTQWENTRRPSLGVLEAAGLPHGVMTPGVIPKGLVGYRPAIAQPRWIPDSITLLQ
ncbi:protein phosphatase 1G [Platysternon megacephalum]|uniref:Protein phosphatase 1G n=1 Tax=Platysternon megacephalum TaxID=55544 RepID=A0A4D9DPV2_9SAUR|nr:protein phosphatase 1G [Platysternon megacephalum]